MRKQLIKATACALLTALCISPMTPAAGFGLNLTATAAETTSKTTSKPASKTDSAQKTEEAEKAAETTVKKQGNPLKGVQERIAQAKKDNPNNKGIVGWLTVTGTNIHEPICFSPRDNNYYLYRDIKGTNYPQIQNYPNYKKYPDSVTFLDYRTKFGDKFTGKNVSNNYVLYGHNWNNLYNRDGETFAIGNKPGYTMFAQLPSYTNQKFAEQNPYIYFSTEKAEGIWKVFAVAYTEVTANFVYNTPNYTKASMGKIVKEWQDRSIYDFDVDVNKDDSILTLSTCTRQYAGVGANQRYVVVARLLREGESTKDKVAVTVNKDVKQPKFS